jgi:DNA-binding response OmpR family regulator
MKLLVVDDYAEIVNILAAYLELSGHEIDKALSGGEAVALLRNNSYDVVITDAEMPGTNGMELCKFLKSRFSATYVIGLSGSFNALKGLKAAGADICFSKPFDICRIEEVVKKRSSFLSDPGTRSVMNGAGRLRTPAHLYGEGRCLPTPSMRPLLRPNPVEIKQNDMRGDWQPATEGAVP